MENYTLNSIEVAEMVEKEHSKLLKDIRRYSEQLNEAKIGLVDFFKESTYIDGKGESRPCYLVTKKEIKSVAESNLCHFFIGFSLLSASEFPIMEKWRCAKQKTTCY